MRSRIQTELDPESKIWRLTDFGIGFLVFGARSDFEVNFSDSVHLCFGSVSIVSESLKLSFKGALNPNFLNLTINREKFCL